MPIDNLIQKVGSIYKLVILASRRTRELSEGAASLVDAATEEKPSTVALKEILEGKVSCKAKEEK
jgi:DNA-directed RNA polymerase subunit omega